MKRVKSGRTQFLTATDVAARGIDISDLTHVLNYSLPEDRRSICTAQVGPAVSARPVSASRWWVGEAPHAEDVANQYEINFEVRPLPSKEEAAQAA